jgi:Ser/Thr protein kinase RdoA (MazF antagonist)
VTALLQTAGTALAHYAAVEGASFDSQRDDSYTIRPLGDGLINDTFLVEIPAPTGVVRAVLQRVNPLFGIAVHHDIEAVTQHLVRKQLCTPLLIRTRDDQLAVDLGPGDAGGVWRMLTYVEGQTFAKMTEALAAPAGELTARFHTAVSDLQHRFHFVRAGAHDLERHLRNLATAVDKAHSELSLPTPPRFFALADSIFTLARDIPLQVPGPLRICHGDLKLNNLRFGDDGQGLCLLDLDTLAQLPLGLELGDALRSWCNPAGEDQTDPHFDLSLLQRVLYGYMRIAKSFISVEERDYLILGTLRITTQLAARFAADVVNQSYFRYDPARYASRAAHNYVRAQGQLALAQSLVMQRREAESLVQSAFSEA